MQVVAERWLDRREAAKRAGVHYNTIRKWHEDLHLFGPDEVRKDTRGNDGIKWFYDISALDRIVSERHTPGKYSEGDAKEQIAALRAELAEVRAQLAKSETERRDQQTRHEAERRDMLEKILRLAGPQ